MAYLGWSHLYFAVIQEDAKAKIESLKAEVETLQAKKNNTELSDQEHKKGKKWWFG